MATPDARGGTGGGGLPVDDVDAIVAAWARERPDLDLAPLEVLSRVSRIARRVDRVRSTAFAAHGLDTWEFDVLAALRRAGDPYELSPGELVRVTMVTSGTMTTRVDRLLGRGLVERHPSPNDRRGILVRLTPAGSRAVDAAMIDLVAAERTLVADLPERTRAELVDGLRAVLTRLEA